MTEELENLSDRLGEAAARGDEAANELQRAVDAYRSASDPTEADHESLVDRMREGALRYESSHPKLSSLIAGVVDSLTASGI